MSQFGWAIIGPGKIAQRFADAVHQLPDARLVGVHGRDTGRAGAFAQQWSRDGVEPVRVFQSMEELLAEPWVRAVYIATPHAFHADAIARCLAAGKPVLCEKSLVANARQAHASFALSRQSGVFLMEALWTRFLPIYTVVGQWLASGAIGAVRGVQSSFCFRVPFDASSRLFDPAQAGGCLLDLGIYNLSMSQWSLQQGPDPRPRLQSIHASGSLGPSGVDHRVAASLAFSSGAVAQFQCGFDGESDNSLRLFGESGVICLPARFWESTHATLQQGSAPPERVDAPFRINGFEGEIEEAMRCILRGDIESAVMPHADSLDTVTWMDEIRAQLGVSFPFE